MSNYWDSYRAAYMGDTAFIDGALAALELFAWWKDGVEMVGCGVMSLEQAKKDLLASMKGGQ